MAKWDASTWWTAFGTVAAIIGVLVAVLSWRRPRSDGGAGLGVAVTTAYPVFTQLDGSQRVGDALVAVTLKNPTPHPVKVTWWGFKLGRTGQTMYVKEPAASWEPGLPHVVPGHDSASWHATPAQLRQAVREKRLRYKNLRAFVTLADGRTITAKRRGVPLKD